MVRVSGGDHGAQRETFSLVCLAPEEQDGPDLLWRKAVAAQQAAKAAKAAPVMVVRGQALPTILYAAIFARSATISGSTAWERACKIQQMQLEFRRNGGRVISNSGDVSIFRAEEGEGAAFRIDLALAPGEGGDLSVLARELYLLQGKHVPQPEVTFFVLSWEGRSERSSAYWARNTTNSKEDTGTQVVCKDVCAVVIPSTHAPEEFALLWTGASQNEVQARLIKANGGWWLKGKTHLRALPIAPAYCIRPAMDYPTARPESTAAEHEAESCFTLPEATIWRRMHRPLEVMDVALLLSIFALPALDEFSVVVLHEVAPIVRMAAKAGGPLPPALCVVLFSNHWVRVDIPGPDGAAFAIIDPLPGNYDCIGKRLLKEINAGLKTANTGRLPDGQKGGSILCSGLQTPEVEGLLPSMWTCGYLSCLLVWRGLHECSSLCGPQPREAGAGGIGVDFVSTCMEAICQFDQDQIAPQFHDDGRVPGRLKAPDQPCFKTASNIFLKNLPCPEHVTSKGLDSIIRALARSR